MTLSGPEALRSLDDALRDIRREEDEIARRLARSAELVTKFRETESELLRQLAAVRLDPQTQAELSGRLSQAEMRARDMLARHADELATAEKELKEVDRRIADLAVERNTQTQALEKAQQQLARLAEKAAAEVAGNPDYVARRKTADELAEVAAESLRKTELAEADREQKGRPYREDPLFMYLWERGYGTRNYRENNLIRYLDGIVAGMVRFPEARVNFAMLNDIPLRLREHAERQQQTAQKAEDAVEAMEKAAIDAAGGRPAREAMEGAEARIAAIDAEMLKLEDSRDEQLRRQRDLAQGRDPAFAGAVEGLADALSREDIRTLIAEARRTETGRDDTIVKQIDDIRQRAQEEDTDSRDQRSRLKTLAARRRELEDIQYEFKKQNFDNPHSRFREDKLVGDMLDGFLRGSISAADYWGQWRNSQSWDSTYRKAPPSSGSFQWPDSSISGGSARPNRRSSGFGGSWGRLPGGGGSGGSSGGGSGGSGGGFSRPRSGSSGSRKGGGFKTGGGF